MSVIAVPSYCDLVHQTWNGPSQSTLSYSHSASTHIPLLGGACEHEGQRAEMSQSVSPQACSKLFHTPTTHSSFLKYSRQWQNLKQGLYNHVSSGHAELNWMIFSTLMCTENLQGGLHFVTETWWWAPPMTSGPWNKLWEMLVKKCNPKYLILELKGFHHSKQALFSNPNFCCFQKQISPFSQDDIFHVHRKYISIVRPSTLCPPHKPCSFCSASMDPAFPQVPRFKPTSFPTNRTFWAYSFLQTSTVPIIYTMCLVVVYNFQW